MSTITDEDLGKLSTLTDEDLGTMILSQMRIWEDEYYHR